MNASKFPSIKTAQVADLIPYARNSRTHSDEQVSQIAASIKEFGFLNPVIVDGENGIIAGHGRVLAAKKLGMIEVPAVEASHLTDAQRRAYIIADNKLALNAGWDDEMLRIEFDELGAMGFDLDLTGFSLDEINALQIEQIQLVDEENPYSDKVNGLIYEPTGENVVVSDAYDSSKVLELIKDISNSRVNDDEKSFLMAAATRHYSFDYAKAAEIYANSNDEMKQLMEKSALVIVDYNKAIELGYAKLKEAISNDAL